MPETEQVIVGQNFLNKTNLVQTKYDFVTWSSSVIESDGILERLPLINSDKHESFVNY